MKYSDTLGKKSSKILLGTAYFGETVSQSESFEIMDTYLSCGGNHIDTARMYAEGNSEKVIGKWLKDRKPAGIFLSTKGAFPDKATPDISRLSESDIRYDIEHSLAALGVECVDLYWLHRDDETIPVCEIVETVNKLVKEGKTRRVGASNWRTERIAEANEYAEKHGLLPFLASQIRFSPAIVAPNGNADRTLVDMTGDDFEFYRNSGIPVCAYASQAKGFFSKMAQNGEAALSQKAKDRYLCEENRRRLDIIKRLSEKYQITVAAAVCTALSSITSVDVYPIIGSSSPCQVRDSISDCDITFNKNEIEEIFKYHANI